MQTGSVESTLVRSAEFLHRREVYGLPNSPLPAYLLLLLSLGHPATAAACIKLALCCIAYASTLQIFKKSYGRSSVIYTLLLLAPFAYHVLAERIGNMSFAVPFAALAVKALLLEQHWRACTYIAMALSCDVRTCVFLLAFSCSRAFSLYKYAIDHTNTPRQISARGLAALVQVAVPLLGLFVGTTVDMHMRTNFGPHAAEYSLGFQTALKGFSMERAASLDRTMGGTALAADAASSTDAYVMDRSIISLVNLKHRTFINHPSEQNTGRVCSFEIQKIHQEDFSGEEPRFIENGDTIKLRHIDSDTFLGIQKAPEGSEKFADAYFGEFENDHDMWRVECDGMLRARSELLRLVHTGTGLVLCCTKSGRSTSLHGSVYAEKSSRLFCIVSNSNHTFFKTNFSSPLKDLQVHGYFAHGYLKRLAEYAFNKLGSSQLSAQKVFDSRSARATIFCSYVLRANLVLSAVSIILLLLNYVSLRRYKRSVNVLGVEYLYAFLFLGHTFGALFAAIDWYMLLYTSVAFNLSIVSAIHGVSAPVSDAIRTKKRL
ncbi:hypothetical protein PAPHI01_0824 [Pancytospora philotis]|nr:hypothetical protein PAPHI01_0824 [Pancytospora philotis]